MRPWIAKVLIMGGLSVMAMGAMIHDFSEGSRLQIGTDQVVEVNPSPSPSLDPSAEPSYFPIVEPRASLSPTSFSVRGTRGDDDGRFERDD